MFYTANIIFDQSGGRGGEADAGMGQSSSQIWKQYGLGGGGEIYHRQNTRTQSSVQNWTHFTFFTSSFLVGFLGVLFHLAGHDDDDYVGGRGGQSAPHC